MTKPDASPTAAAANAADATTPAPADDDAARVGAAGSSEEQAFMDDLTEPAPGERLTEAAHDDLAEAEPELTEAELARERELLEQVPPPPYDIPMVTNDKVLAWVDYYSDRHPASFSAGLVRSGKYIDMFRRIFAEAGIPQDLVYMAHVESAYKTTAYSRAHAKGIFQFIAPTARRYGLRVDYWVDERSDPEKSARAAAAYLTDLHAEFGDWYLALAGYNAGEGRIRRGLRAGADDFWEMADRRLLRRETRNYVPAILAATLISKNPERYGLDVEYEPPVHYDTIAVEGAADLRVLGRCAGTDLDEMRALNPALRRLQTPPNSTTEVRVPVGMAEATLAALAEVPVSERVLYARHRVRSGDTLYDLARAYGVSVRAIQDTNGMGRRTVIRVGQELTIPTVVAGRYAGAAAGAEAGEPLEYRVRRGDSLSRIAARYGTSAHAIAAASGIGVNSTLRIGQRLTVVPGARSAAAVRAAASGEPVVHVVRRGDTLSEIAAAYGTSARAIADASGIGIRSTLRIGQRLTVAGAAATQGAHRHTVRRGDTLWLIARRYGTTVDRICALNSITRSTTIHPGTVLTVAVN